jgi:hypothetical protein
LYEIRLDDFVDLRDFVKKRAGRSIPPIEVVAEAFLEPLQVDLMNGR